MIKLRAVLRRRWPLLVITALLGAGAGFVSAAAAPTNTTNVFKARQVLVASSQGAGNVQQDSLRVTRGAVAVDAAKRLQSDEDPTELAGAITATADDTSKSIEVSTTDTDPKVANERVDAYVQAFLAVVNDDLRQGDTRRLTELQSQVDSAQAQLATFDAVNPAVAGGTADPANPATAGLVSQRQILQEQVQTAQSNLDQQKIEVAQSAPYSSLGPEEPQTVEGNLVSVPTSVSFRVGLLGGLGFLLGVGLVFVVERVSRRIDTREELIAVIDFPVIAEVGFLKEGRRSHDPDGALLLEGVWAEPYRRVRSAIQFVQTVAGPAADDPTVGESRNGHSTPTRRPQVFLVTSTSPGEGKSTTAALTGEALAEVGTATVVIGGDFRRPEVDRLLGVPREPSLQDFAQLAIDRPSIDDVVKQTRHPNLYVAPAGRGTREVSRLVEVAKEVSGEARERGATVIFDSSPLQAANDTLDLLPVVDYVILVVRSGRSTASNLQDAVETLQRMDAKILGVVLIGTPSAGKQQSYYYDYYSPSGIGTGNGTSGHTGREAPANGNGHHPVPASQEPVPAAPPPWVPVDEPLARHQD